MPLYHALLLLIMLFCCLPSRADTDGVGSVNGIVTDADYKPMAGAVVTLEQANARCQTDKSGQYAFPNVLPGLYLIRVDAAAYISREWTVLVRAGVGEQVTFTLNPTTRITESQLKETTDGMIQSQR